MLGLHYGSLEGGALGRACIAGLRLSTVGRSVSQSVARSVGRSAVRSQLSSLSQVTDMHKQQARPALCQIQLSTGRLVRPVGIGL